MKKKTPKVSKRRAKQKEKRDRIAIIGIFIVFIAVLGFLLYTAEFNGLSREAVATVNGKEITKSELDWWYHTSILPEHREIIAKKDFLALSLVPQEVLVQEARKSGIKASKEEIEKSLGIFIIDNGWNLEEFEAHLASRGITLEQIKQSFEIRLLIIKLLEKENLDIADKERLFFDGSDIAIQDYVAELVDKSKIEIFPENIEPLTLASFEETNDDLCSKERPIVRLYTTTKCSACESTGNVFKVLLESYTNSIIEAKHWSLDTGDDLLTVEKENGVPKEEVELFKKYGKGKVPLTVIGCKYKLVGSLENAQDEFNDIMENLVGG